MTPERLEYEEELTSYTCRRCQRRLKSLEFDGEHEDCESEVDTERRGSAIRRLHRDTARLLRRAGFPEEAAYHDLRGEER